MDQPHPHTQALADVTVVIPAMNRQHLIKRSLDSVSAQTTRPRAVVVVDDASTDETAAVARANGATLISMPERSGSGPARNAAIAAAETEWLAFLDSDDEWTPDHLEQLMRGARQHPEAVLLTAPARTPSGRWMGSPYRAHTPLTPRQMLVPSDLVVTSGTAVRRATADRVGGFRPLRRAQDLDLWLRVLESGPGVALPKPTVVYHEHPEQASADKDLTIEHFTGIMDSFRDRPWMTERLRDGAWGRVVWDRARAAQSEGRRGDALRGAAWFLRHPLAIGDLARILARRRRARIRARA